MRKPILLRDLFKSMIKKNSGEWLEMQSGWFGDLNGIVDAGDGKVFVRLHNGKVEEVVNRLEPGRPNMPVKIGRSRTLPGIWQVIEVRNIFDAPPGGNAIKYHHEQHMFDAEDMLPVHRKQIIQLTAIVSPEEGDMVVRIYGDIRLGETGYFKIASQVIDLSAHVPTTGARYVVIESNGSGVLSANVGSTFAAAEAGLPANIPIPAAGKYPRAVVLLQENQTVLKNSDITVPMPFDFNPEDLGVHAHALDDLTDVNAPSPTDGQVLTYDFYAEEWIAADPTGGGGISDAPSDGELYGRKNGTWEVVPEPTAMRYLVMATGVTNPPVPVQNAEGDDWIYST